MTRDDALARLAVCAAEARAASMIASLFFIDASAGAPITQ